VVLVPLYSPSKKLSDDRLATRVQFISMSAPFRLDCSQATGVGLLRPVHSPERPDVPLPHPPA
jgi:hypothetical protein